MTFLPANVRDVIEALLPERYSRWIGKRYAKPSEAVDAIQERLRPFFESHQFRRQSRCFCRRTDDGVTLVIAFQISSWGLSDDGYGRFTINTGVFIPEVWETIHGKKANRHISEEKCVRRRRIGWIGPDGRDIWRPARDHNAIQKEIQHRISANVLPYLATLETREQCLAADPSFYESRDIIDAILLNSLGRPNEARQVLNKAIANAERKKMADYADHVRRISDRLSLPKHD